MSDCCAEGCDVGSPPRRHRCPVNGQEYSGVSITTILHHIQRPWALERSVRDYFYCHDPACEVVYFGNDDSVLRRSDLRTSLASGSVSGDTPLCFCFGISREDAEVDSRLREFVVSQTRDGVCACKIRNPSGRCCLKDFPDD